MPKFVSFRVCRGAQLRAASVLAFAVVASACSDDPPAADQADAKVAVASAALTVDASDLSGWTEAGELDWREESVSITDPNGSYPASGSGLPVLHASECAAECQISMNETIDLTMAESATLTFLRYVDVSLDSSDYLRLDFWRGSWNEEVAFVGTGGVGPSGQDDGQWLSVNYDLDDSPDGLSYLDRSDFRIRFRAVADSSNEIVELDDIKIQVDHVLGPDLDWTESGEGDWSRRDMLSSSGYPAGASGSPVASVRSCSSGCELTSDPIDLTNTASGTLSLLRYVRSYIDPSDYLRLQAWDGSSWITEYDWNGSNGGDSNQWEQVSMDLSASPTGRNYLGQSDFQVRLVARADSSNEYIEVDDVTLVTACAPSSDPDVCDGQDNDCDGTVDEDWAASCPASTECLQAACVSGVCQTTELEGLCSDSTVCTTNEYCEQGACVATGTLDCDDGNECTDDLCDPLQGCDNPFNTATCDDGDSCTSGDICGGGSCDGTPITACQNADGCCPSGCNDSNDSDCGCGDGVLDPGEECDDGNNDLDHCGPLASCATCGPLCTWVDGLVCGDAQLDPGEECDDGNLDNGDGCQADCTICTNPASADDICDGLDDDCDGRFDEDVVGRVTSCGEGACFAYSTQSCQGGAFVPAECVPHAPGVEGACDGIDDDCDGAIDEDTSLCQQCSGILASAQDHAEAGRAYRVATCAPIFAEHFDGDLSAWTVAGTVDIVSASTTDLSGPGARLRGASELRVGVDTSHYRSAQLRYWRRGSSLEGNDTYEARYSTDGGVSWTTLESTAGSVRAGPRAYALPESDSLLISFQTSFSSTSSDRLYLDDIVVTSGSDLAVSEEFEGSLRLYVADGTVSLEGGQGDRFARLAGASGSYSDPHAELELEVDTAVFSAPVLTYRSQGAGSSDPDTPDLDYSTDGGQSWTALQPTLVVNDTTDRYAVDLPVEPRLRLRFTGPDGDVMDAVYLRGLSVDDAGATADTIFVDEFETDLSQWEVIADNLAVEIEDDGNGSGSLRIDGDAELRALIDTAPYGATLDIESSLEGTAGLTFRYTTDGVTWTTVHTGPRSFHEAALELPASSQLLLSLVAENASGAGNEAHVERLRVRARPRPEPVADLVELQAATNDLGILIPTTTGSASINESSSAGHLGLGTGIRMTGPGEVTLAIDTSGHDSAELQFWTHSESMESSDMFRVRYSLDGGTTYESDSLYLHHGTSDWEYRTADLPISADLVLQFDAQLSSTSDHALLDEVRVIARPTLPASGCEDWLLEGTSNVLGQDAAVVSTVFEAAAGSGEWLATTTGDLTCDGLDEDCDGTVDEQCEGLMAASDGTLLIELEGYDDIEPGEDQHWAITANTEASQGLAVHLEDGGSGTAGDEPWLHYEVRFTEPGRYYAWLRADVTQTGGSWTYPHIHLQGQHITTMRLDPAAPDYSWQRDVDAGEPEYIDVVLAGNYTLSFKSSGNAYREYDQLLLTLNPDFVPQGTPVCGDPAYAEVQCVTECSVAEHDQCVALCTDEAGCASAYDLCDASSYCSYSVSPCVEEATCDALLDLTLDTGDSRHCEGCLECYEQIESYACGDADVCANGGCLQGTVCTDDYDCSPPFVCRSGVADLFGQDPSVSVCWHPSCDDTCGPGYACGQVGDLCGDTCPACTPSCGTDSCGCDGCGATCGDGTCGAGETGCLTDLDCDAGLVCADGTCIQDYCYSTGTDNPCIADPLTSSECPNCDDVVDMGCGTRNCGVLPTGEDCGTPQPDFVCNRNHEFPVVDSTPPTIEGRPEPSVETSSVGAMPGALSVTPTGGVSYRVPLELPPGRGGVTPSLALSYNSGRPNSHVGLGWTIEGLQSITRCNRTVVQDGRPEAASADAAGPFCLNGRRLVEIDDDNATDLERTFRFEIDDQTVVKATIGIDPDDLAALGNPYTPQLDGYEQPLTFDVTTKDGTVLTFGETAESRIASRASFEREELCGIGEPGDPDYCQDTIVPLPVTQTWMLSRITDRNGNYAYFAYDPIRIEETANAAVDQGDAFALGGLLAGQGAELTVLREHLPRLITYSMNEGEPHMQGMVEFHFDTIRPDPFVGWLEGVQVLYRHRLSGISVYGLQGSRRYNLGHDTDGPGGQSRVTSIQECYSDTSFETDFSDDPCLPPTRFDYEDTGTLASPLSIGGDTQADAVPMDFNGDGKQDLLLLNGSIGSVQLSAAVGSTVAFQEITLGTVPEHGMVTDFNNDGLDDILVQDPSATTLEDHALVYLSTGQDFVRHDLGFSMEAFEYLVDLNADGRPDVLTCAEEGGTTSWRYRLLLESAHPATADPADQYSASFPLTPHHGQWVTTELPTACPPRQLVNSCLRNVSRVGTYARALDTDGDGAQELVFPDDPTLEWRNDIPIPGTNLASLRVHLPSEVFEGATIERGRMMVPWESKAADLNGDGRLDFYTLDYCADTTESVHCEDTKPASLVPYYNTGVNYPYGLYAPGNAFPLEPHLVGSPVDTEIVEGSVAGTLRLATAFDYDGDGRQDILAPAMMPAPPGAAPLFEPRWVVFRSVGRSFELAELPETLIWDSFDDSEGMLELLGGDPAYSPPVIDSITSQARSSTEQVSIADVNGDGQGDIVKRFGYLSGLDNRVVIFREGSMRSRMVQAVDGMGAMHAIAYGVLTDSDPADPLYSHAIAECPDYQRCAYPAGSVAEYLYFGHEDDQGQLVEKTLSRFSYANARLDVTGRGPLGFGSRSRVSVPVDQPTRSVHTVAVVDNLYREPTTGLYERIATPTSVSSTVGDEDLSITTLTQNVTGSQIGDSGGLHPYVQLSRTTVTEQDGAQSTVLSDRYRRVSLVDQYGNPQIIEEGVLSDPLDLDSPMRTDVDGGSLITVYGYGHVVHFGEGFDQPGRTALVSRLTETFTLTGAASPRGEDIVHVRRTDMAHDDAGNVTLIELERGATAGEEHTINLSTVYERDAFGNVTAVVTTGNRGFDEGGVALGAQTRRTDFHYDYSTTDNIPGHLVVAVTNAENQQTLLEHDPRFGEVVRAIELNGPSNGAIQDTRYDGFGRVVAVMDAEGNLIETDYREADAAADPELAAVLALDDVQLLAHTHGPGIAPAKTALDWFGRGVGASTVAFDAADPAGKPLVTWTVYDDLDRPVEAWRPHVHDPGSAVEDAAHYRYEYDAVGRPARSTWLEAGVEAEQTRCYQGLLACTRNARGFTSCLERDVLGRIVRSHDPSSVAGEETTTPAELPSCEDHAQALAVGQGGTEYRYGEVLERVVDSDGNETRIVPDRYGRTLELYDPDTGLQQTQYNPFGEVVQEIDGAGRISQYRHDQLGRLERRIDLDAQGPGQHDDTWWYYDGVDPGDYVGALSRSVSPDGHEREYTYDALGRLQRMEQTVAGVSYDVRYENYLYGVPTQIVYPDAGAQAGLTVHHQYDGRGTLVSVHDAADMSLFWELGDSDEFGRLKSERLGEELAPDRIQSDFTYDDQGRLAGIVDWRDSGGTPEYLRIFGVDYDLNGNVGERTEVTRWNSNTEVFQYDRMDRIRYATIGTDVRETRYNGIGNITFRTGLGDYAYAAPNPAVTGLTSTKPHAVTSVGSDTYAYDDRGSIVSRTVGGTAEYFEYTPFHKPRAMWRGNPDQALGTDVVTLEYDADTSRVKKVTDDLTTVYVDGMFEHRTSSGEELYVYQVSNGSRVVAQHQLRDDGSTITEESQYLHADHLGSTAMISLPDQAVTLHLSFDAFGHRRNASDWSQAMPGPDTSDVRVGFTGHEADREYDLVNMGGREYDPVIGRFMMADPIVQAPFYSQSLNRYTYVFNNPLAWIDPSGYCGVRADASFYGTVAEIAAASSPDVYQPPSSNLAGIPVEYWDRSASLRPEEPSYASVLGAMTAAKVGELINYAAELGAMVALKVDQMLAERADVVPGGNALAFVDQALGLRWDDFEAKNWAASIANRDRVVDEESTRDALASGGKAGAASRLAARVAIKSTLTFGRNYQRKLRKHWHQMRATVDDVGVELPRHAKHGKAAAMQFLGKIVSEGKQRIGDYVPKSGGAGTINDALWSRMGDAIVVRRPNGEFLTFLRYSQRGAALGWDSASVLIMGLTVPEWIDMFGPTIFMEEIQFPGTPTVPIAQGAP